MREPCLWTVALAEATDATRLHELADQAGWIRIADKPRGFSRSSVRSWRTQDDGELHYYENHMIGCGIVLVGAGEPSITEAMAERISAAVPVRTESDLLELAMTVTEPEEIISTVLVLGHLRTQFLNDDSLRAIAPDQHDPRYRELVERLAGHPNRHVRRAVMITTADWLGWWPQLAEPILARQAAETELTDLVDVFAAMAAEQTR